MSSDPHNNQRICICCGLTKSVEKYEWRKSKSHRKAGERRGRLKRAEGYYRAICGECINAERRAKAHTSGRKARLLLLLWSPERIAELHTHLLAGLTAAETAIRMGRSVAAIHSARHSHLPGTQPFARGPLPPRPKSMHLDAVRELLEMGCYSYRDIGIIRGISRNTVSGLVFRYKLRRRQSWPSEQKAILADLSAGGRSASQIATAIRVSADATKSVMRRNGLFAQSRSRLERVK